MNLVLFLLIGLVAGWLAGQIMKGRGLGLIGNLVVGVIGAFLGGYLFGWLDIPIGGLVGTLIAATVGAIILLCRHLGAHIPRWPALFLPAGLLLGGFVVTLAPASTPDHGWFIFLCGAIAISAMILPGLSGSFILLMLKKYAYIFNALGHFDLSVIIPFVLGILSGLALFSRFLSWLLDRFYQQTLLFITGLLIASLYAVWPFQHRVYETVREKARLIASTPYWPAHDDEQALYAGLMLLIGLGLIILLDRLAGAAGMIKTRAA